MAAPRAAGMPVWWPRRPAAATAAVAAGAGPGFSCAGELEQLLKALIGEVRSLSVVCVCVSGLLGKVCGRVVDIPPWSVCARVLCACWGSGFCFSPKQDLCVSRNFFASGGQSAAVFVRVCQHDSFVKSIPCSLVPLSRSISIWLAKSRSRRCLLRTRLWCHARAAAARSALCAVFGGWESGVF